MAASNNFAVKDVPPVGRPLRIIRPPVFSPAIILSGLRLLFCYRSLLYRLTRLRISVRYRQSVLGWLWALIQPLSLMIVYSAIFSRVAKLPSEGVPYPVFVLTAVLPWVLFASAITNATTGLVNHSYLVMKVYFPREIIPLSYVAAALVDFAIASLVLGVSMVYYKVALSWNAVYALPIIAVLALFATAVSLLLSALQVRFRDVGIAMPLVLQIWMLTTPVVYPLQSVPPDFRRLYLLNPVAALIESFRRVVLHGDSPDIASLGIAIAITVFILAIAYGGFKTFEGTMADFI